MAPHGVPFLFVVVRWMRTPTEFDQRALLAQDAMPSMAGPKGRGFRGCNAKDEQSPANKKAFNSKLNLRPQ